MVCKCNKRLGPPLKDVGHGSFVEPVPSGIECQLKYHRCKPAVLQYLSTSAKSHDQQWQLVGGGSEGRLLEGGF